jgi:hypothetical protein
LLWYSLRAAVFQKVGLKTMKAAAAVDRDGVVSMAVCVCGETW